MNSMLKSANITCTNTGASTLVMMKMLNSHGVGLGNISTVFLMHGSFPLTLHCLTKYNLHIKIVAMIHCLPGDGDSVC